MPFWSLGPHEGFVSWPCGPGSNLWAEVVDREASILGRNGQVGHLDQWKLRRGAGPQQIDVTLPLVKEKPHNWGGVARCLQRDWMSQETNVSSERAEACSPLATQQ